MSTAYLGLGSNLGNKREQLLAAIALIAERAGDIPAISGFHETAPDGFESVNPFLNAVIQLETLLRPIDLLAITQQIECALGRTAKSDNHQYADRLIDIDIIMYDGLILESPDLILPHPLFHQRLFVLQPLSEIAPNLIHPVLNQPIANLLQAVALNS